MLQSTQVGTKTIAYSSGSGDDEDFADISEIFDLDASFVDHCPFSCTLYESDCSTAFAASSHVYIENPADEDSTIEGL